MRRFKLAPSRFKRAMSRLGAVALALALTTGFARTALAEEGAESRSFLELPRARQGYWLGVGLYGTSSRLIEEGRDRGNYGGWGYSVRIGQLLTEHFGLGLLYESASIKNGNDKGATGGLILEASYNLWRNLSAHTGLGVGYDYVSDKTALDTSLRGGAGSYFLLGTSYDFFPWHKRLTGGWAVTPTVDFRVMPDGNIHAFTLFAGIQVMRWSGLPNNMLFLPEE
jgi:hypothetical protein